MIILRQKTYSWDEIKRATKSIGIGAATGAAIGYGPVRRHSKIGAAIGCMIGALLGVSAYKAGRIVRKEDERFKEEFREKYGEDFLEVLKKNRPKEFSELKKICNDIHNFNDSSKNNSNLKHLSLVDGAIGAHLVDNDEMLNDYISSYRRSIIKNEKWLEYVPVIYIKSLAFGETVQGSNGYIMYNFKTKNYTFSEILRATDSSNNNISIKNILLSCLEGVKEIIDDSTDQSNEDDEDFIELLIPERAIWESEYYNKLKKIIERIRL